MKKNNKKRFSQKTKSIKSVNDINREAKKIIEWNKKGIGLSANLQRSLKQLTFDTEAKAAEKFIQSFEQEPLLQEMYEWFHKVKKSSSDDEIINEIRNLIEAFFERLNEKFNISVIEEPESVIETPSPNSKYYRFENKYSSKIKTARVLRCGLRFGSKLISPCIVAQIDE